MPRTCTVCAHPQRAAIDKALVDGQPYRDIAGHYGTSKTALQRHKDDHLRDLLTQARARQAAHEATLGVAVQEQEAAKVEQAIDVVKQLKAINAASLVNVLLAPEWVSIRAGVLAALLAVTAPTASWTPTRGC